MSEIDERCRHLYLKYATSLINYAQRYVDDFSAEDIVHDAFLKFYGSKMMIYTETELQRLLYATVRNLCIDQLRHESCVNDYKTWKTAELMLRELEDESDENIFKNQNLLNRIVETVDLLPDKRKTIFRMYYYKGLEVKKIASILSLSHRTVENNIYRALLFIRKCLPKKVGENQE